MKPPGEIQVPARGPPHICYKGENRELPKMIGTLSFTFRPRRHRERWHLASLCARKNILEFKRNSCSSENSETGLE